MGVATLEMFKAYVSVGRVSPKASQQERDGIIAIYVANALKDRGLRPQDVIRQRYLGVIESKTLLIPGRAHVVEILARR